MTTEAMGRQARQVAATLDPAERTGSRKGSSSEPGAETGKLRAHLPLIEPGSGAVEASPGICERSPECGSGSISGSATTFATGRPSSSERVPAGGPGETRESATSQAGETPTTMAGQPERPVARGGVSEGARTADNHETRSSRQQAMPSGPHESLGSEPASGWEPGMDDQSALGPVHGTQGSEPARCLLPHPGAGAPAPGFSEPLEARQ